MRYKMHYVLRKPLPCKRCFKLTMEFVAGRAFGVCSNCGCMIRWERYASFLHRNPEVKGWYELTKRETLGHFKSSEIGLIKEIAWEERELLRMLATNGRYKPKQE